MISAIQRQRVSPGRLTHPHQPSALTETKQIQRLIYSRIFDPKVSNSTLCLLTRAWVELEERKRILRGIPLPGMFRPDLDPAKLAKRMRKRALEMPSFIESIPDEVPRGTLTPEQPETSPKVETPKS